MKNINQIPDTPTVDTTDISELVMSNFSGSYAQRRMKRLTTTSGVANRPAIRARRAAGRAGLGHRKGSRGATAYKVASESHESDTLKHLMGIEDAKAVKTHIDTTTKLLNNAKPHPIGHAWKDDDHLMVHDKDVERIQNHLDMHVTPQTGIYTKVVGHSDFGDQEGAEQMDENNQEVEDEGEYDYEGDMAMSQLKSVITNAQRLHDMMEPDTNLPEWVQSKITLAEDYIVTAANYMEGEMNTQEESLSSNKLPPSLKPDDETPSVQTVRTLHPITKEPVTTKYTYKNGKLVKQEVSEDLANVLGTSVGVRPINTGSTPKSTSNRNKKNAKDALKTAFPEKPEPTPPPKVQKESDESWAAAQEKQMKVKQDKLLTPGDKNKLGQIRDLVAKEKKPVSEARLSPEEQIRRDQELTALERGGLQISALQKLVLARQRAKDVAE